MGGITTLRKIQGGVESSLGVEVDATAIWRFTGTLEDLTKVNKVPENAGFNYGRTNIPAVGGRLKMQGIATFEQLLYVLLGGVDGSITDIRDGSGPYVYTFPLMTTTAKTPKTYTIEGGNNQQEEQMCGAFVEQFILSGGYEEATQLEATWRGQQVAKGTFTSALVPGTVYDINTNLATIAIEAANGTIGATVKASLLSDFKLTVDTGFQAMPTANGQLYYTAIKQVVPTVKLEATMEHDANSVALIDNWRAQTGNLVRLKFIGAACAVAGSTYSVRTLLVDAAMKWMDVKPLETKNGDDLVKITGEAYLETACTPDLFANITLVNDLAAPV